MIPVDRITHNKTEELGNWYDDPIIAQIASIIQFARAGDTKALYNKQVNKVKDYFADLRKTLNDQLDAVEKHILDDYDKKENCNQEILVSM